MDFINKNVSVAIKIIIAIVVMLVFLRILPWIVVIGGILWAANRGIKRVRTYKKERSNKKEKVDARSSVYSSGNSFDFSNKNVIDVEYEEV